MFYLLFKINIELTVYLRYCTCMLFHIYQNAVELHWQLYKLTKITTYTPTNRPTPAWARTHAFHAHT